MVGLELVAGYLAAWAWRKARRAGDGLDIETDHVIDVGVARLHDLIEAKLGPDPALAKLEAEAAEAAQTNGTDEPGGTGRAGVQVAVSERTRRRVQDAIEEATETDEAFATDLQVVLAELEASKDQSPTLAQFDLRGAQGVQLGNNNTQSNTFN